MTIEPNEGDRPSLLQLGRWHTGESPDAAAALAAVSPSARATLTEMEAARAKIRPFDASSLRARAARVDVAPAPTPRAANRPWLAVVALLAAVVVATLLIPRPSPTEELPEAGVRFRGGGVQVYTLDGRALAPWDGEAVRPGDVLGFKVDGTDRRGVVLLSVDGAGQVSVLWPEGDAPAEPLRGDGLVALPGTLTLDDAPGPEVFVAVYDQGRDDAVQRAQQVFASEGANGLLRWAESERSVDAVLVPRAP